MPVTWRRRDVIAFPADARNTRPRRSAGTVVGTGAAGARPAGASRRRCGGGVRRPRDRVGRDRVRRQYGLRPARAHAHRQCAACRAAALARAVAFGRHGRVARRCGGPAHHRAQGRFARPRLFRRALERHRGARRARQCGHPAVHSGAGLGRRVGRSRPARASRRGADRRRRSEGRRPRRTRARCARGGGAGARGPRPQGGPGAPQRHAGVDRPGARGAVRRRTRDGGRLRRRRAVARRLPRQRHAVRSAYPCRARPSRSGRRRGDLSRAARRQLDPRLAQGLSSRAGSVQPALPAPGDGRMPRPDAACRRRAAGRSERGLRQSAGLRERKGRCRRGTFGGQFSRRAGRIRGRQPGARHRGNGRAVRASHGAA